MASSKDYLNFILEQLSDLESISYRPMMGEFIIYYKNKVVGGIYDDRFLLKNVRDIDKLNYRLEIPYKGAKEMVLIEDVENKELLHDLIEYIFKYL